MDESTPQAESKLNLLFETYIGTAENTFDKSPLLQDFDLRFQLVDLLLQLSDVSSTLLSLQPRPSLILKVDQLRSC